MNRHVYALALVACASSHDDGFRSRLAEGCHSDAECIQLHTDADRRARDCLIASGGHTTPECQEKIADRNQATDLLNAAHAEAERKDRDEHNARIAAGNTARANYKQDVDVAGSSCQDIARLNALADKATDPQVAEGYRRTARVRHDEQVSSITMRIDDVTRRPVRATARADLAKLRKDVADLRGSATALTCYDAAKAADEQTKVAEWASASEQEIAAEEKCRADAHCRAVRQAHPICELLERRRSAQADIARERSNPAGVVNLTALHDDGAEIQDVDAELPRRKAEFAKATGQAFAESLCKETPRE